MEFLNDLKDDLHTTQDAWNEEAARRTELMSTLYHSTEKERKALSQLVSNTVQEDSLFKTALVDRLAANANLDEFLKAKVKKIQMQTFISSTRCRLKTLTSSFDIEPPEQWPMAIDDQVPIRSSHYPSSFEHRVKTSTVARSIGYNLETQDQNQDPSINLEYTADTPVEDLLSLFLATKKQELNTVLNIFATQVKEANENLQGRRESHQEHLDVLNDYADNIVEQVEHKLKVLKNKSSAGVTSRISLEFGQAHTTEYLGALWSTAIQFMSSHRPKDPGNIEPQVMAELYSLDHTIATHCKDFAVHSSFMRTLSSNANYPEPPLPRNVMLSGDIPTAPEAADDHFAPSINDCFVIMSNSSENDTVYSISESCSLATELARIGKKQVSSTAEVPQLGAFSPSTDEGNCSWLHNDSKGAVQVEITSGKNIRAISDIRARADCPRCTSPMVRFNEIVTTHISTLFATIRLHGITYLWNTLIFTQSLYIPIARLVDAMNSWNHSTIPEVEGDDNSIETAADPLRWVTVLLVLITQTGLSSLVYFSKEILDSFKASRTKLLVIQHSKIIFLLSSGILVVLWLKALTDRRPGMTIHDVLRNQESIYMSEISLLYFVITLHGYHKLELPASHAFELTLEFIGVTTKNLNNFGGFDTKLCGKGFVHRVKPRYIWVRSKFRSGTFEADEVKRDTMAPSPEPFHRH
ncbi:hypothetical protein F5879DRAFT_920272 [Lentinula edodes]|nr:hypothetical protein F5879DRAFT_920272 [Lentinula edodes]